MSDFIGVLGIGTGIVQGVTTAYTVPSGKTAKIKLFYRGVAGVSSTLEVLINGITSFKTAALTSGNVSHSTTAAMHNTQAATAITGGTDATTVAPGPKEYFLDEGDTVQYTIATADFTSMSFQVVGSELDKT